MAKNRILDLGGAARLCLTFVVLSSIIITAPSAQALAVKTSIKSESTVQSTKPKPDTIILYAGFGREIVCEGRLLGSYLGNTAIIDKDVVPPELGCGLILTPTIRAGSTNLIIKTSVGGAQRILEIRSAPPSNLALATAPVRIKTSGGEEK